MTTLKEILEKHYSIELALMEAGGELTPEIESMLDENDQSFEDKLDGYASFIDHLKTQEAGLKAKIESLQARKKSLNNTALSLRQRMLSAMQEKGLKSTKTSEYTYSCSTRKALTVDIGAIPDQVLETMAMDSLVTYERKFDLAKIKKQYSDAFFVTETEKDSLTIRG